MKPACKDCKNRTASCHTVCESYKEFVRQNEDAREQRREQSRVTSILDNMECCRCSKWRRR